MRPYLLPLCLAAAVISLSAPGAQAQTPPTKTFADSTSVMVIEVPVEVTLDGEPLAGLTRDSFRLEVDGKKVELLAFEEIDVGTAEQVGTLAMPDVAPAPPVAARRRLLFLLDLSNASVAAVRKAQDAAQKVLAELAPSDLVAVGTLSRARGFELLLYYSPDHSQVQNALISLSRGQPIEAKDPLRFATSWDPALTGNNNGRSSERNAENDADLQALLDRSAFSQVASDAILSLQQLGRIGDLCRSVNGRKHIVFFSAGLEDSLFGGTTNDPRRTELSRTANESGQLWRVNSDEYFGSNKALNALDQTIENLRRADCVLHTVDTSGIKAGGSVTGNERVGTTSLFALADGTGGTYFENFNKLEQAASAMLAKTRRTYLLAFQAPPVKADGKFHKIAVELVGQRGAKVRHRPGFFAADPKRQNQASYALLELGSRLLDDRRPGELNVSAAAWGWKKMPKGLYYTPLIAEMATPAGTTAAAPFDVLVYAFDQSGQLRDVVAQRFVYDPKAGPEGLRALLPIFLPEGRFSLRVLARDPANGRTGLAVVQVEVASEARAILVPEEVGPWQLARGGREGTPSDHPFAFGEAFFSPALDPQVRTPNELPLVLVGLDPKSEAKILSSTGQEITRLELLGVTLDPTGEGIDRRAARVVLPELPAGAYTLEIDGMKMRFEVSAEEPANRFVDVLATQP